MGNDSFVEHTGKAAVRGDRGGLRLWLRSTRNGARSTAIPWVDMIHHPIIAVGIDGLQYLRLHQCIFAQTMFSRRVDMSNQAVLCCDVHRQA